MSVVNARNGSAGLKPVHTPEPNSDLASYLDMTKQSLQQLLAGGMKTGSRLFSELVPKALKERKKLVWREDGEGSGSGYYSFEQL